MVAKTNFTDRGLRALKAAGTGKRVIIFDAQVPGFGIRVTDRSRAENVGTFVLVARFGSDNPTARAIGSYPATSLAKAREVARGWREDLQRGIDPKIKERDRQRQEQRRQADTFEAVFSIFADEHLTTLRSGKHVKRAVEKHVFPHWRQRPISELRRVDVLELVRTLRKETPVGVNRTLAYLKKFFGWCVDQDLLEASPAAAVKRPARETQRDRVLTDVEIRAVWTACGELGPYGAAMRFMLATGARRNEVGEARWREIDLPARVWRLPRERTKADRRHELPLSVLAAAVLDECPKLGDVVFTTGFSTPPKPLSSWSTQKQRLDALTGDAVAPWRIHDLRRSCATNLARLGADRVVISRILNHAEGNSITAVYDRHSYQSEMARALDLWAKRLQAIVDGTDGGNVVQLVAARG